METDLKNIQWGEFEIGKIFKIENCKCSNISLLQSGNFPYVGATNRNNGVLKFVKPIETLITKGNCIAFICDGEGSVGYSIYKEEDFIGSTTVKVGRNNNLNKYVASFIISIADTVRSKYNFGFKRNEAHLKKEKILLPVNSKDEPDYAFMEQFMRQKEQEKIEKFQNYITKRVEQVKDFKEVEPLNQKKWEEFRITDFFKYEKGDQNNMAAIKRGEIPLVSAKKGENGYKDFATQANKKLFSKNSLTLNNDGDGGAGISYYQPTNYLLDSHVTSLYSKTNLNRNILLFFSRCITSQRDKFGHGYSITNNRLNAFKIMLPTNKKGQPDYDYMENYIKKLEHKKLLKYLTIKTQKSAKHQ